MAQLVAAIKAWGRDGRPLSEARLGAAPLDVEAACPRWAEHVATALAGGAFSVVGEHDGRAVSFQFAPTFSAPAPGASRFDGQIVGVVCVASYLADDETFRVLRERLAFEELITDLSTKFVDIQAAMLDEALTEALGAIGRFAAVDRAYIFRFTPDGLAMNNTHEWCAEGIVPQIDALQGLSLDDVAWWAAQLKARRVIHVPDVDAMEADAASAQEVLRAQDIQSALALPMICDDKVVGFVGFDSVRAKKTWPNTDIALLRIAGEIFTGAIERARRDTEQKRLEAQLVQAKSLENVAHLAGGVAHDFNNLLAVILNYATLLKRELVEPSQREKVSELFDTARRAAELTRQLLYLGRRDVVEPMLLDLNAVVGSLRILLSETLGDSVQLSLELADDIDLIHVGLPQLEQVIINLALNARDAMPRGGELVLRTENVEISPSEAARFIDVESGKYVRLSVTDEGVGMSAETLGRALEPFFTTKGAAGTGLGLSTVDGITKKAGGHLRITSEPGRGTTVAVYLPSREGAEAETPRKSDSSAPTSQPLGRGERILVVDDSASLRKLVCALLEEARYRPVEAATPEEAIAACDRYPGGIALLLTDVVMPRMSGKALAEQLRETHGIARVLYMSGYDADIVARQGVVPEGTHLLTKPFLEGDLVRAVRRALDAPLGEHEAVNGPMRG